MVCGTLLDGFPGQIDEHGGFLVADPVNRARGYLHLFARKPVAGFDDQLADPPTLVVHHKIADVTEQPVAGLKVVTADGEGAAQMRIGAF